MKIALTTSENSLDAPLDSRFGRAQKFLIYDLENGTFESIDNAQNLNAAQGAGIQSAQNVVNAGVKCVITGHCGPKAFRVLTAAGIGVYCTEGITIAQALERFKSGSLQKAEFADVEGHW